MAASDGTGVPTGEPHGFWRRLLNRAGAAPAPQSLPPLFRSRPVPPVAASGPGLPPLDELLTQAPPVTEAMLRALLPPEPPDEAEEEQMLPSVIAPAPPPPRAPAGGAARGIQAVALIAGEPSLLLPPPALAAAPPQELNLLGSPGRLFEAALLSLAADGAIEVEADAPDPAAPAELAVVLRHPHGLAGAPLVEIALALFTLHRAYFAHLKLARIYVGRQDWAATASPDMAAELLAVLFPDVMVVGAFDGTAREPRALLVDGALRNGATGTLIGGMMPQVVRHALEARQRIFAAFGLPATAEPARTPGRRPKALYLHAPPPRALADPVRERLLALLQRAGYDVVVAEMSTLPWRRQVRVACGTDLLIGAHGPALTAVLWGHPQARVLEFFPEGARGYDGQLLAEAAGLGYLGLEGVAERGFVIRARERWGPPAGETNRLVYALPWAMLEQTLTQPGPPP